MVLKVMIDNDQGGIRYVVYRQESIPSENVGFKMSEKKKILIILGHPARERESFCEALANAYAEEARGAGHDVDMLKISNLAFDPILHEGYRGEQDQEPDIVVAQNRMLTADHWVVIYPLWLFMIPSLLKGFLERTLTKGLAYNQNADAFVKHLQGKSVRIIQTMGMPGWAYKWMFHRHGAMALVSLFRFIGMKSVNITCLGLAESHNAQRKSRYFSTVKKLGKRGR